MVRIMDKAQQLLEDFVNYCGRNFSQGTANFFEWCALVLLHLAFVPTYLSMMQSEIYVMPPLDVCLFVWVALLILLLRAAVLRNMLNIMTLGLGFVVQLVLVAFVFFG